MIGWVARRAARSGLRWLVVSAGVRFAARRVGRHQVARARDDLTARANDRLPAPVARAVTALPDAVLDAGGTAVVAGRTARRAAVVSGRAGRLARRTSGRVGRQVGAARHLVDDVRRESEATRRLLWSDYLDVTRGPDAATDALLDVRSTGVDDVDPHEQVPPPIPAGRLRARRRPTPAVNRVTRRYRPPLKPWDG